MLAEYWLVFIGNTSMVAKHDDFIEWADLVKHDQVEYEAFPLYRPSVSAVQTESR